jgi:putative redox protein
LTDGTKQSKTTRVRLRRAADRKHFIGTNPRGDEVRINDSAAGGSESGAGPIELLVMGFGGCSAVDVAMILEKGRQRVDSFEIEVTGVRPPGDGEPFSDFHVHYTLEGEIEPSRAKRAVELSLETYCSAARTLRRGATITSSITLNGVAL